MYKLADILQGVKTTSTIPTGMEVAAVAFDSRKVIAGGMFVATKGTQSDGHAYISDVIGRGAKVIVCEEVPANSPSDVVFIQVANSAEALGLIAGNCHDHPSQKLYLVGVTGTNGKTTTATLLYRLFTAMGYSCGLLSTIENRIADQLLESTHTTPDALSLNTLLAEMVEVGCSYAFMEVSSHAVDQRRIAGLKFAGGIFSNITHDHLDYHKTFQNYIQAKKKFFDDLPKTAFALTNLDDKRGEVMLQNTAATKVTYALKRPADFKARIIENSMEGLYLELDGSEFYSRLVGDFNAYNLLAVYAAAVLLGQDKQETMRHLSAMSPAEGRFECVYNKDRSIMGVVDYAHTPDALEKVLNTLNNLRRSEGKIISLVGCGGDRDRTKRPVMAKMAAELSDLVFLTSDNPRTEDPEAILKEMEEGLTPELRRKAIKIADRREAIHAACRYAQHGDIVLLAGKGHEKYQEIHGVKHPFDDKVILQECFLNN